MYSWNQNEGNWKEPWTGYWTIRDDYGFFHVYAFTMTLGVLIAIGISALRLYRRKIPVNHLWLGAAIAVPISLMGASFFGKLNGSGKGNNSVESFFAMFAFWEGGMAIHGGVLAGCTAGVIYFYFVQRKTRVSLWTYADCIMPNILLGQAIGRWGNFFNHEVFGPPIWKVGSETPNPLGWLPNFILVNTQFKYGSSIPTSINGMPVEPNNIYQMQPIFLYESFGLFVVWVVLTFLLPIIVKICSKKPWHVNPQEYTFLWECTFKHPIKSLNKKNHPTYFSTYKKFNEEIIFEQGYKDIKSYNDQLNQIKDTNFIKKRWAKGKILEKTNNPHGYTLLRSGVQTGGFLAGWNIIRFILELDRPEDHLFLMYNRALSLSMIALTALAGITMMILAQWVIPYLFRAPGFIYEQEYFITEEIIKKIVKEKPESKKVNLAKEQKARQKLEKLKNKK